MALIRIVDLTILAFGVNAAIDSGNHSHITLDDIRRRIEDDSIFEFLENEVKVDTSLLTEEKRTELLDHWRRLNNAADSRRKFGVERSGLCLILAYLLEGAQNGTA